MGIVFCLTEKSLDSEPYACYNKSSTERGITMQNRKSMCVIALLLTAMLLAGCGKQGTADETPGGAETSAPDQRSQEDAIKAAFLRQYVPEGEGFTAEDLSVRYVCRFDDGCAVFVDGILDYPEAEKTETVNGLEFFYSDYQTMLFFRGGALYTLPEAFGHGVNTADELRQVYDAYREVASKQYPYPSCDGESLSPVDEAAIKAAYLKQFAPEKEGLAADDVTVLYVCRFVDGCAVFVDGGLLYPQMVTTEIVNGLTFRYPDCHTMHFYRGGVLYTLPEAFESGVITADELRQVHDAYAAYGRDDVG